MAEKAGVKPAQTQDFTLVLYRTEVPLQNLVARAAEFEFAYPS